MILEIENLRVGFEGEVLSGVSLGVPKGKIVAVVGKSGSGKTVTGLSVMGLLKWYGGKITDGKITYHKQKQTIDLARLTERELETIRGGEIAMIFQDPAAALNPIIKIEKQLMEVIQKKHPQMPRPEMKRKMTEALKELGFVDADRVLKAYPFALSGGMCQRVLIAMAVLSEARLIIADEPTTFLDEGTEEQILDLLKQMNTAHGCSILFITHDLELVSQFAHYIAVMLDGKVVETGETEAVFKAPKHPYTKKLLESIYGHPAV